MLASRYWLLISLISCFALCLGCGGDPNISIVSGTVTVDGEPLETGSILFVPVDGNSPTSGGEIAKGNYSVEVPVGTMKVALSAPKVIGKKKIYPTPESPEMPITVEALPPQYNERSELKIEVTPPTKQQDFHLKSDSEQPPS